MVILLLESTLILFVIFEYKNAYGKVQEQYAVIGGILVFIVILCIHALLYKIKYQEKQAEHKAGKAYKTLAVSSSETEADVNVFIASATIRRCGTRSCGNKE